MIAVIVFFCLFLLDFVVGFCWILLDFVVCFCWKLFVFVGNCVFLCYFVCFCVNLCVLVFISVYSCYCGNCVFLRVVVCLRALSYFVGFLASALDIFSPVKKKISRRFLLKTDGNIISRGPIMEIKCHRASHKKIQVGVILSIDTIYRLISPQFYPDCIV